jgi:hypothetical protein
MPMWSARPPIERPFRPSIVARRAEAWRIADRDLWPSERGRRVGVCEFMFDKIARTVV